MTNTEERFLKAYSLALNGTSSEDSETDMAADNQQGITALYWRQLFSLAESHRVFPMIFEAVYPGQAAFWTNMPVLRRGKKKAEDQTCGQARMTAEFLKLYRFLEKRGLSPIAIKGIMCRRLYPNPEQRSSSDEDLLIPEEEFMKYHKAFIDYGLRVDDADIDIEKASEVSYYNDQVYIELHKSPFPPESKAYGDLNRYFKDVEKRKIAEEIYGVSVYTMEPSDHIFYQLCHAYKHFLNCGIGIRLVSDVVLFSMAHREQIDWELITERCHEIHAMDFASAIYRIGEKYLFGDRFPEFLKQVWHTETIDESPLLQDILAGGVYGTSSEDRLHSSNITLGKMESEKKGTDSVSVIGMLFPRASSMKQRYPELASKPFLLPVYWLRRICSYAFHGVLRRKDGNAVTEAVRIGNERVSLMKSYRMIGNQEDESWLKRIYKRTHSSALAPVLSPIYKLICGAEFAFLSLLWYIQGNRRPDKKEAAIVRKNVTFIVKSFERQRLVKGLCRNISRIYPGVSIIIADDSREPLHIDRENVKVIPLPFNSGLGAGLYAALEQVQTPYVFRMDDDELLTLKSKIHRELKYLIAHPELDLIGLGHTTAIRLHSPEFNFQEYYKSPMDDTPFPLKIPHMTRLDENHLVLGKVANIYLARTEKIREVGYDPKIKVIDHHEFFWRAAGKIVSAVALDTVVFHRHNPYDRKYNSHRSDYLEDLDYIRKKRLNILREVKNETR